MSAILLRSQCVKSTGCRLIFNLGISIHGKNGPYIKAGPRWHLIALWRECQHTRDDWLNARNSPVTTCASTIIVWLFIRASHMCPIFGQSNYFSSHPVCWYIEQEMASSLGQNISPCQSHLRLKKKGVVNVKFFDFTYASEQYLI